MPLSPVSTSTKPETQAYPRRENRAPTWRQRAVTLAAATLTAAGLFACDGRLELIDHVVDTPGMIVEPSWSFVCSPEEPETLNAVALYDVNYGELCGEDAAWAAVDVDDTSLYRFSLVSGAERAAVALIDPDGAQKAQIDLDSPTVDVELTSGRWIVAVTALDPSTDGYGLFELSVQRLQE